MEEVKLGFLSVVRVIGYLSSLSESNYPKNAYVDADGIYVITDDPLTFKVFAKTDGSFETDKIVISNGEFTAEITSGNAKQFQNDYTVQQEFKRIVDTLRRIIDPTEHSLAKDIEKIYKKVPEGQTSIQILFKDI